MGGKNKMIGLENNTYDIVAILITIFFVLLGYIGWLLKRKEEKKNEKIKRM
jgi:hypothetical protein